MKILVVEDKSENLEAAKRAVLQFSEVEFEFLTSASQALGKIGKVDGIITDLFFPQEYDEKLNQEYQFYIERFTNSSTIFQVVVDEFYGNDISQATERLQEVVQMMREGNIQLSLQRVIERVKSYGYKDEEFLVATESVRKALEASLSNPLFPYGAVLMLLAKAAGISHVLITDLHRHANRYQTHSDSIDGMILLLPLIEEGVMTVQQAIVDGDGSTTYVGKHGLVCEEPFTSGKENPKSWVRAIRKVLAQF